MSLLDDSNHALDGGGNGVYTCEANHYRHHDYYHDSPAIHDASMDTPHRSYYCADGHMDNSIRAPVLPDIPDSKRH